MLQLPTHNDLKPRHLLWIGGSTCIPYYKMFGRTEQTQFIEIAGGTSNSEQWL